MLASAFGRSRVSRSIACGALAAAAIFSARRVCALDATWTAAGSGNWADGINWSTNPLVPDSAGDTALFPTAGVVPVINIDAPITVGAITFDSQKGYTLSSAAGTGSLVLSATSGPASITVTNSLTAGTVSINVPLQLLSDLVLTNNAVAAGTQANSLTINGDLSGSGKITANGPGTVVLAGDNSNWSGNILVDGGGTLTASSAASLGTGSAEVDGGVLGIRSTSFSSVTVNTSLTLNGGTVAYSRGLGALIQQAGITIINSGTITQASQGNTTTLAGDIAGSGTLTFNGADITSAAANAFAGLLSVNATLTLSSGAGFTHVTETDVNVGGALRVTNPAGAIDGVNSLQVHSVVLKGGTLALAGDVDPSALLSASSTGGALAVDVSNATFGGTNVLDFSALPAGGSMGLGTMNGGSIAATVDIRPDASNTLRLVGLSHNGNQLTINAALTDHGAPLSVDVASGGFVILAGNSSYSGQTTVEGSLTVASNNGLGAGTGSDADGTVLNGGSLTVRAGVAIADEKITLSNGGSINNAGTLGGPIVFDSAGTLAGSGTFSGPISGAANFGLSGSITLSGDNTYTGTATITSGNVTVLSSLPHANVSGGTLTLSGPQAGAITLTTGEVDVNAATNGAFAVSGGTLNMNVAGSGNVSLTGGGIVLRDTIHSYGAISLTNATLTAVASSSPITVSGLVQTQGSVTIFGEGSAPDAVDFAGGLAGSGVLRLFAGNDSNGTNGGISASGGITYTGALYLSGNVSASSINTVGWLKLGAGTTTASSTTVTGDLYVIGADTLNGSTSVTGTVWQSSASFNINGIVSANHWVLGNNASLTGAGAVHIADGALEVQQSNVSLTGTLDAAKIVKTGLGTVTINALPASYTGTIDVQQGTAIINGGVAASTASIQVSGHTAVLQLGAGTFANPIALMNAIGGTGGALVGPATEATLTGVVDLGSAGSTISGGLTLAGGVTGGSLTITGYLNGTTITAPTSYTGDTTLDAAILIVKGNGNVAATSGFVIDGGRLDVQAAATGTPDRLGAAKPMILEGGDVWASGDSTGAISTSETVGLTTAVRGANTLTALGSTTPASGVTASFTLGGLQRTTGATVFFGGLPTSTSPGSQRIFITGQTPTDFMGGGLTAYLGGFLRYDASLGVVALADSDYAVGPESIWTASQDVWVGSQGENAFLSQNRTVRSLRLTNATIGLGANTLNVISGGIVGPGTILGDAGNRLTAGGGAPSAELFLYEGITVAANITDNPGADGLYGGPADADNGHVALVVSDAVTGTTVLSGANSYTGGTFVDNAELQITAASAVAPGDVAVTGGLYELDGSFIANLGNLTLHYGRVDGTASVNAVSYTIESGRIDGLTFVGSGTLTKTTNDAAIFNGNWDAYTGDVDVLGGLATFNTTIHGNFTVDNAAATVTGPLVDGTLSLKNGAVLTLSGMSTLSANGGTIQNGSLVIVSGNVDVTGSGDPFTDALDSTHHADVQDNGSLLITQGNKAFGQLTGDGILEIDGGASLAVQKLSLVGTTAGINDTGILTLRPNGGTSDTSGFSLSANGTGPIAGVVDITNNRLVIRVSGTTSLAPEVATLQSWVASARNGGAWNGAGITSSTAAADGPGATIAVVDNGQLGLTKFGDAPVDDRSILLMETFIGDANLDHAVTVADLARLAPFFNTTTTGGWADGDFNGDGVVNAADVEMLEPYYGLGTTGPIPSFADALASVGLAGAVPTPEPASLLLLGAPVLFLTRRRKR